jgi:hypothetical protein
LKTKFIILSFLSLLTIVELIARSFVHPNYSKFGKMYITDPDLIYRHKPNSTSEIKTSDFYEKVSINSSGTRGEELIKTMPSIAFFGDSMIFGHGVKDNETFVSLIGKELQNFQMINAAVKGYGVDQSRLLFDEIIKNQNIKKVVFAINKNDIFDDHIKARFNLVNGKLKRVKNDDSIHYFWFSRYYKYIHSQIPSRALDYFFSKLLQLRLAIDIKKNYNKINQQNKIVAHAKRLITLCQSSNIQIKFLLLPVEKEFDYKYTWFYKNIDNQYILEPNHFTRDDFIKNDIHFNKKGNIKMANFLLEFL